MLIATFGPSTSWEGTHITWADGRPVLENHGPITPRDVMEYDRQGHLLWTDEGTRAWVGAMAVAGARSAADQERSSLVKRVAVFVIVGLLVLNLVLLVLAAHSVHLF